MLKHSGERCKPRLSGIIRVGENESDISYERGATKRCETLGVACEKILLPADVSQEELLSVIDKVNKDPQIHGVLLFRPLPKHLNQSVIENASGSGKRCRLHDRWFHVRRIHRQERRISRPAHRRPAWRFWITTESTAPVKKAVVVGRSLVVGKPAAMMLIKKNATVTVCHTRTVDMPSVVKRG